MDFEEAINAETNELSDDAQYLTFRLEDQEYALPIVEVQEIKGWTNITPVPNAPKHILGVLSLRGTIIPVVDLRVRFGLQHTEHDESTVIIVVNMGSRIGGLVVDSVSDVVTAGDDVIKDNPEASSNIDQRFFSGLIQTVGKLIILLNINQISEDIIQGT